MTKPRLLDLFCGAGGAAMGYHRAGFEVVGVDIKPQPNYPFEFIRWDAIDWLHENGAPSIRLSFNAVHASPPCPRYSSISRVHGRALEHPDLIGPVRDLLRAVGLPYVIENVPGSPLLTPAILCGSAFNLGCVCRDGKYRQLRRHRGFESSMLLLAPECRHDGEPIGVYGHGGGQHATRRSGRGVNRGYMGTRDERRDAMAIDWMSHFELTDAIPPAYTEWVGSQLLAHLEVAA